MAEHKKRQPTLQERWEHEAELYKEWHEQLSDEEKASLKKKREELFAKFGHENNQHNTKQDK